jgi:molybdate transport system substrate-binding protein
MKKMIRRMGTGLGWALLLAFGVHTTARADELLVSAAASLTNAFQEIGKAFEASHPDAKVTFNFAASGALLQQIVQGAPVDVFASADQETMDKAQQQNLLVGASRINFVSNKLVMVVPADSTIKVAALPDLLKPEIKRIAIGSPASVPVGRYTQAELEAANLWSTVQPKLVFADNVRQALTYVARGEVEVGFVYSSDAGIEKEKVRIATEVPTQKPVIYPIARIAASKNQKLGGDFLGYVLSPAGQQVLTKYGFGKP